MCYARIWAQVKLDQTGSTLRLPVIFFLLDNENIPLRPLLHYVVNHSQSRSHAWMNKLCEIVEKLIDYIQANNSNGKPVSVFRGFVNAMYNGTFDKNNHDPSGLCWFGTNARTLNPKLRMLEEFSDWMNKEGYSPELLNPWTVATSYEERFNWLAWYKKSGYSFLGHLDFSVNRTEAVQRARSIKRRKNPVGNVSGAIAFPANFEHALLREGFVRPGKRNELEILRKFEWRDICIALLLLYGARRTCEPFHLWTGDVVEHPTRKGEALVRIYHPIEGRAPQKPTLHGRPFPNRQTYLQTLYPPYVPRNIEVGNQHAGFKGRAFYDRDMFIYVYWLPSHMAEAFFWAYRNYMLQRAQMGIDGRRHPFAFVSHHGKYKGEPYSIKSFQRAWERAVKRIGLVPGKRYGTSPHGARHGFGKRANKGKVDPFTAQEAFAHSSVDSQRTYRVPSTEQVTEEMDCATLKIQYDERMKGAGTTTSSVPDNWMDIWVSQEDSDRTINVQKRRIKK